MARLKIYLCVLVSLAWVVRALAQDVDPCSNRNATSSSCTSISNSACSRYYSHSIFPNRITSTLRKADEDFLHYAQLVSLECSTYTEVYLCLALFPHCDPQDTPTGLGPCRSLCEEVTTMCATEVGFFSNQDRTCLISDCTRFPVEDCIDKNHPIVQGTVTEAPPTSNTSLPCPLSNNTFFSDSSKSFATGWISFWAVICFISTTVTIFTFLLDTSRFEYPWRPVVYLAITFNIHSLTYFFSLVLGRGIVTCPNNQFVQSGDSWTWGHAPCILVFIFLYFTMMASFIWWVILTICWFLVSALKWSHEAVAKLALFFQCVAWILPLLMTIALLAGQVVGADELTGTCFVVSNGTTASLLALLIGVVIPLILFLLTGVVFLLLGFISIMRVRAYMRRGGRQEEQQSLEKLIIRIGIFVAVYIIPASVLIGCFIYELASRPNWRTIGENCTNCTRANSAVFIVRIFMFLLIGILTGVWIWSKKTLKSWQQFPDKCVACCRPPVDMDEMKEQDSPPQLTVENVKMSQHMPTYSFPDSGLESS